MHFQNIRSDRYVASWNTEGHPQHEEKIVLDSDITKNKASLQN